MANNSSSPRIAALDVGSNSVRLLVAEARGDLLFPVFSDRITSRLFAGLQGGRLHKDAIARTQDAILRLADGARAQGASRVFAFGTSAMRDGENRGELIEFAARHGVSLQVMSGDEEAALSYAGAAPGGSAGVIDIGGGSTELLLGEDGVVQKAASAQMGAVRLLDMLGGVPDAERMIGTAKAALCGAWTPVRAPRPARWIGLGGTITSLAAMQLGLKTYDPERIEGAPIRAGAARSWLDALLGMPVESRKRIPGLNPARADIMPCGVAILCAFFALSGADLVFASDRDNLLGYLKKKVAEGLDKPADMR